MPQLRNYQALNVTSLFFRFTTLLLKNLCRNPLLEQTVERVIHDVDNIGIAAGPSQKKKTMPKSANAPYSPNDEILHEPANNILPSDNSPQQQEAVKTAENKRSNNPLITTDISFEALFQLENSVRGSAELG